MRGLLLLLLFLLVLRGYAHTQVTDHSPYFRGFQDGYGIYHWSTSNGLPQSHISGIAQTDNKIMWIATYAGVISYDGKKFAPANVQGRPVSSFVTAVEAFGDSVIWASTKEVVIYYRHRILDVHPLTQKDIFLTNIHRSGNGFVLNGHKHILRLEGKKLSTLVELAGTPQKDYFISASVPWKGLFVSLLTSAGGNLLITSPAGKPGYKVVQSAAKCSNLKVVGDQLLQYSEGSWRTTGTGFGPGNIVFGSSPGFPATQSGIFSDLQFYYGPEAIEIRRNDTRAVLQTGSFTHGNEIFASLTDHTGNLWLGTNSFGLFMFRRYPFEYPSILQNVSVTNSSHVFPDGRGTLWFDNECIETYGIDLSGNTVKYRIPDICSWVNESWSDDTLALFAFGTGHSWYNLRTRSSTPIRGIDFAVNNCLKLGYRKFLLFGEGKVYEWDGSRTKKIFSFRAGSTICNQVERTGAGRYLLATTEGLYEYSASGFRLMVDSRKAKNADFRSLFQLPGTPYIFIGTAGHGILRYHVIGRELDPLPYIPVALQNCWSMIGDNFGQLWITSNNGIVQLSVEDLQRSFNSGQDHLFINHYRYETGIENVEFNSRTQNKGYRLADGRIVFSSLAGPIIINPQNNKWFNSSLAQILIDRIAVNDKETAIGETLRFREGDFVQIAYTLPSFSLERVLQFEYRIVGYRNDWSTLSSRQITLDNLPAGKYRLQIRLISGKRQLSLPMEVSPANPSAWILYLLLTLSAILGVVLITAWLTRIIQRRKHAAQAIRQRLKILEMEALQSQMNPHFLFNCLNTIQFLFISGQTEKANKYLSDFSTLMRMTLDQLRVSISTLDVELKATMLYVELEQLQFDEAFELRVINDLHTPESKIKTPAMFLQIFVENAIVHGLRKTTEPRPILTLAMDETEDQYIFRIGDNGPGFSNTTRETHKSLGLSMLRERFELKNEVYNWDITFKINEWREPVDDIRTEIVITFGKTLHESIEDEDTDS
jgi:hypothetical protein